jgi:cytochrome c oxidase subunit 3
MNAEFSAPYDSAQHRSHAVIFGFWIFLASEILFFGGLFVAYTVYHYEYASAFLAGSQKLNVWSGGVMTTILLLGSLLVATADHLIRRSPGDFGSNGDGAASLRKAIVWRLGLTALLGVLFLGGEFTEYYQLYTEGLFPAASFERGDFSELPLSGRSVQMFFVLFFCMTGLHALHMIIAISLVGGLAALIYRSRQVGRFSNALAVVALYWHFVDIVWVFLYPFFYLVR